jgi:hypothetical protein
MVLGVGYSWYDFGTLATLNQLLEMAMVAGFLIGTYLLAKQKHWGYLWFMLMNVANGVLMYREHYPWLVVQQAVSLAFVTYAFYRSQNVPS